MGFLPQDYVSPFEEHPMDRARRIDEKIRAALSKTSKARQDIFIERLKIRDEIQNILTPEQREELKAMGKDQLRDKGLLLRRKGRLFQRGNKLPRFPRFRNRIKQQSQEVALMGPDLLFKSIFGHRFPVLLFVLFLSAILQVGCGTLELNSNWRDREITVDGKNDDWLGVMYYFEDSNISVGLLNDEKFIYICMIVENPLIRKQVMRQGFRLWFDPEGGKERTFGIKFPIGRQVRGLARGRGEREQNPERFQEAFEKSMTELEILGPGKDVRNRMLVEEAKGIEIDVEASSGMLVYELKVPLLHSEQHPYAVGAKAGDSIGIGLETPKIDRKAIRKAMSGKTGERMPGGGRGGGVGMRGGRRPQMPNGLKIWAAVQLASDNSLVSN